MNRKIRIVLMVVVGFALAVIVWTVNNAEVSAGAAQETTQAENQEAQRKQGQALAETHMAQWKRENPDRASDWVTEEKERHKILPPADNSDLLKEGQEVGDTYGQYTERDILMWAREAEKLVVEGSRIFHDAVALRSTVAVSCDMCHPDATNTHPETYPKFQAQMGRVALLRDMINWCNQNPVRFDPDDPRMRALEAYICAQRKDTELNYGPLNKWHAGCTGALRNGSSQIGRRMQWSAARFRSSWVACWLFRWVESWPKVRRDSK